MLPGCFYLIGMWYKRSEAQRRNSFFFSSTTLAKAFAGLLASAIGKMDGLRGYSGWRWIFILEGVLTCVVGLAFFFLIPSSPEEAKRPTPDERAYVKARLRVDRRRSAAACLLCFVAVLLKNRKRDRTPTNLGISEYHKAELGNLSPDCKYLL